MGSDFRNLNRNKRAITLDLKQPEGVALLKRLAVEADVVLENFRPDVKHRLGIDYETLSAINPRLVYASISGFGQSGPYRTRPGFDQIAQGMGGIMSLTGTPEQGPLRTGIAIGDLSAGIFCAYGILLALIEREASGRGQWVQTSLVEALAFMLDFQAAQWLMDGIVPTQNGNDHPTMAPTGAFRTADGFINIAVVGEAMWQRFCTAMERPDWLADGDFGTNQDRVAHRARLNAAIETVLGTATSAHWVEYLNARSVPCGPIYRVDEMFDDPQMRSLGIVRSVPDGDGTVAYLGQPITLTRTPSDIVRHAPAKGEHTDEVLQALGLSAAEIARLRDQDVI
jgi:crotonobetainyl-CoA:carnitine CoA-transferase CaiB-like acyl-CoA transferase